ncbi:phosphatidate cytidylyltransferase [Gammaproteobacteria bacterium]|nr:phosphatidate cytidylyltransferase [Gammaproteobacteria bacterium]
MTELSKRILTILLILPLLVLLFIYGNNVAFHASIYILSIVSFYEWMHINSKNNIPVIFFIISMPLLVYLNIINLFYLSLAVLIGWVILIYCMILIRDYTKEFIRKYFTSIGFIIFTSFFLLLIHIYSQENTSSDNILVHNKYFILLLITLLSSIDIFAYISGKLLGKNRIISNVSPNKTLEGYIGGYGLTVLFLILVLNQNQIIWTYFDLLYLTIFILLAFFGDLFMSFVKRIYNIKDTSSLLPGHGGVLDRLDSYFPSLPLFYVWVMI